MKPLGLFSYLVLFTSGVVGSLSAGPYQTVAMWYAYRMDIQAYGSGNTLIAPDCLGSLPDKSCTFNEFVKYTSMNGRGTTSISDTDLDPEVEDAAQALRGSDYNYAIDQQKLVPSVFASKSGATFSEMWKAIGNVVEACRKDLTDNTLGSKLDKVRYCMSMVHYARQSEMATAKIDDINDLLREAGASFSMKTKRVTAPNGASWDEIDPAATLTECQPGCTEEIHQTIVQYAAGFEQKDENNRRHYRAIQAAQAEESRVMRPAC